MNVASTSSTMNALLGVIMGVNVGVGAEEPLLFVKKKTLSNFREQRVSQHNKENLRPSAASCQYVENLKVCKERCKVGCTQKKQCKTCNLAT